VYGLELNGVQFINNFYFASQVHAITKLIQCAEFTNNKMYTVVITIDDLDRVPLDKVCSMFLIETSGC